MLICPKCKAEYRDGFEICSDCKIKLIEMKREERKDQFNIIYFKIIESIIGIAIILFSSILSYKLTHSFFLPYGTGIYNENEFLWMLKAYQNSFLLVGGIICLDCILFWFNIKKKDNLKHFEINE